METVFKPRLTKTNIYKKDRQYENKIIVDLTESFIKFLLCRAAEKEGCMMQVALNHKPSGGGATFHILS